MQRERECGRKQALLKHGAEVNAKTDKGETTLFLAKKENHSEIVELLIVHGANINVKDNRGRTPLYWAVHTGSLEVAGFLVENDADAGLKEEGTERTALDMARDFKRTEVVEFLEKYGAKG